MHRLAKINNKAHIVFLDIFINRTTIKTITSVQ